VVATLLEAEFSLTCPREAVLIAKVVSGESTTDFWVECAYLTCTDPPTSTAWAWVQGWVLSHGTGGGPLEVLSLGGEGTGVGKALYNDGVVLGGVVGEITSSETVEEASVWQDFVLAYWQDPPVWRKSNMLTFSLTPGDTARVAIYHISYGVTGPCALESLPPLES